MARRSIEVTLWPNGPRNSFTDASMLKGCVVASGVISDVNAKLLVGGSSSERIVSNVKFSFRISGRDIDLAFASNIDTWACAVDTSQSKATVVDFICDNTHPLG